MNRSLVLAMSLALGFLCGAPAGAQPRAFPSKPVTVVVPFPAGGVVDIVGRLLADKLGATLGVRVLVENRPGAGGTLGAAAVAKAEPDGHTLLVGGAATHVFSPLIFPNVPYDPATAFSAIGQLSAGPLVLVVPQASPVQSFADFHDYVRRQGDKLSYASNGPGTFPHMAAELYRGAASATFVHVSYGGGPKAMLALAANEVAFSINHIPNIMPLLKSARVRALATTGRTRAIALPDLPTFAEGGIRDFETSAWFGLFAPAGTPATVIARLNSAVNEALKAPDLREKLMAQGDEPVGGTPEALSAYVQAELKKWRPVVKAANVTVQ
ncbi:MAG: Bug family tripartite tricarboxylate transporter substrate binding protein [Betaproteobacteria bacterium]